MEILDSKFIITCSVFRVSLQSKLTGKLFSRPDNLLPKAAEQGPLHKLGDPVH